MRVVVTVVVAGVIVILGLIVAVLFFLFRAVTGHMTFFIAVVALRGRLWVINEVVVFQLIALLIPESGPLLWGVCSLVGNCVPEIDVICLNGLKLVYFCKISDVFLIF